MGCGSARVRCGRPAVHSSRLVKCGERVAAILHACSGQPRAEANAEREIVEFEDTPRFVKRTGAHLQESLRTAARRYLG